MEGDGGDLTQPTQNVLDPRRIGQQNSGFTDDDISDIICILYPYSPFARQEIRRIAQLDLSHIIRRHHVTAIETHHEPSQQTDGFQAVPPDTGDLAIILRLSANVKDPFQGFQFGRNASRCDLCFTHDPKKRLSNIHFRIYVNQYGVVMLEDQSTNGTIVDNRFLRGKNPAEDTDVRRTLSHGSKIKILMHQEAQDLEFLVRIPKREGEQDRAYIENLRDYFDTLQDLRDDDPNETIVPGNGPGGHPDLFSTPKARPVQRQVRTPLPSRQTIRHDSVDMFPREWKGSDKYNKVGQIGKGAFAIVYKVTSKFDGKPYAAKELEKRRFVKNGVLDQKVDNEMKIMQKVNHPNVVRYIEHFDWDNRLLIIIMEYVPGGDLGKLVSDRGPLPEVVVQQMASQLLGALGYLHENNITHRDVKPDNILIHSMNPFEVKLTDFGLSKMVDNEQTFLRTFCGTLLYCAPEVYSEFSDYDERGFRQPRSRGRRAPPGQRYDHAIDIWSLGGVLFYALSGRPPFPAENGISYSELLHQIMTTPLNTVPLVQRNVSPAAIETLHSMLQRRPETRATVQSLQSRVWLGGDPSQASARSEDEQSLDEITDDELEVGASQLSLQEGQGRNLAPTDQTFPEVLDDVLDDFLEEDSEKENDSHHNACDRTGPGPRLFGEVAVSAVGSSGAIPEEYLNIPLSANGQTPAVTSGGSMETEIRDSLESRDTPGQIGGSDGGVRLSLSIGNGQSADQLQSLVENVQSQSLGATRSFVGDIRMRSAIELSMDDSYYTTSKRKPPVSSDTSDEFENSRQEKPLVKRLRSEGNLEILGDRIMEEFALLSSMPLVKRLESGRQIDGPQDKMYFWTQNLATWHLQYPEMTELQRQVFEQAAHRRNEAFIPGKSPLWGLAMKYFPPQQGVSTPSGSELVSIAQDPRSRAPLQRDVGILSEHGGSSPPPATAPAPTPAEDALLDITPPPETQRAVVVPVAPPQGGSRALAVLESAPGSVLPGISVPITDSLLSWGRGPENTAVYMPRSELKVPKYAVRLMLWKEGYDPSKRPPGKASHPWGRNTDPRGYCFYVSTRATLGIHVNGLHISSSSAAVSAPNSTSPTWVQLYDGDEIVVWGKMEHPDKTRLTFRCFWGGSATRRPPDALPPQQVAPNTARRIEEAYLKTEKRIKSEAIRSRKMADAQKDLDERRARIDKERERTRIFETKVLEAREYIDRTRDVSRRTSSSPGSAAGTETGLGTV